MLVGSLRPLTEAQRKFLRERNGCFACRQIGHRANSTQCPRFRTASPANGPKQRQETDAVDVEADVDVDEVDKTEVTNWDRYTPANLATTPMTSSNKSKGVPVSIKNLQNEIGHNDDWQLNPKVAKRLFEEWGKPKVDLFACCRRRFLQSFMHYSCN